MGKLTGQVAYVTGASRGIGRGLALRLASLGADVAITARNLDSFKKYPEEEALLTADSVEEEIRRFGVRALGVAADVGDREQIFAAVDQIQKELGDISILVCCAGGGLGTADQNKATEMIWEHYDGVMNNNLHGVVNTVNAVAPMMKKNCRGKIVTIASVGGIGFNNDGSYAHYGVAKAGIIHYTKYVAQEMGTYGVTANCVAPGYIATGRLNKNYNATPDSAARYLNRCAIRRFGTIEDVANAVEFMVTDASDYVTGQCLEVSGGVCGAIRRF